MDKNILVAVFSASGVTRAGVVHVFFLSDFYDTPYYTPEKIDLCILRYRILETDVVPLPQNEGRRSQ